MQYVGIHPIPGDAFSRVVGEPPETKLEVFEETANQIDNH